MFASKSQLKPVYRYEVIFRSVGFFFPRASCIDQSPDTWQRTKTQQVAKKKTRCKTRLKNNNIKTQNSVSTSEFREFKQTRTKTATSKSNEIFPHNICAFRNREIFPLVTMVFVSIFAKILHLHRLFLNEKINIIS